jgi:hypothetical protein
MLVHEMSPGGEMADEAKNAEGRHESGNQPKTRFWSWLYEFLIRAVPAGIGVFTFWLAASTKNNSAGLKDLIQFLIAVVAGLSAYIISYELLIRKLPSVIRTDLTVLTKNLEGLNNQIIELQGSLATQLATIESLRRFQKVEFQIAAALTSARALQNEATQSVSAMWTQHQYDQELKDYFAETLSKSGIQTERVVDVLTVKLDDLLDHIRLSWPHLVAGSYVIYITKIVEFESILIDHHKAGLFIYSAPGYGTCYLSSDDKSFTDLVTGLFVRHRNDECRLKILPGADATVEGMQGISEWLQTFYGNV